MNILVINGSPKGERSNTLRLTNAFLEGITDSSNNSFKVEKFDISKMDISPCRGCFSCWKDTPGKCYIHDDMEKILEKLLWADLIIWSFPLYYFNLPGKLKTVIDRQLPLSLPFMVSSTENGGHPSRYDMSDKKTVLISTCGFYTAKSNYDSVTTQFDRIYGKGNYTSIFCGQGELFRVKELSDRTDEYLGLIKQAGKEYICGGIEEKTELQLKEILFPRDVFERMADASWGISQTGEKEDNSFIFTKQMAALYNPSAYNGTDIILDIDYTDISKCYRIILGKTKSTVLEKFDGKPTTIIHTPFSVWQSIAAGEIEGSEALMKHLYSVEGDFDLMIKWDEYFGNNQNVSTKRNHKSSKKEKTDMKYILTSWIVFWIAANINTFWGSIISIFVCGLLPIMFYNNKKTIYDVISSASVSIFSLLLLIGLSPVFVIPASYLTFGIIWSISCCFKIPLTAEYSMNNYGGEKALKNPLFIKTNKILTASWGILYLLTAIWTYFIIGSSFGPYVGLINSILPAIMGIFTVWFQKWYPQKVAKGDNK